MKMTHALWMQQTASTFHSRSAELKALDQSIRNYEQALAGSSGSVLPQRQAVQNALAAWKKAQQAKGQQWAKSVRNQKGAVTMLDKEFGGVITGAGGLNSRGETMMDAEEAKRLKFVADAYKQNLRRMFQGQKLSLKVSGALADANEVRSALSTFKSSAGQIRNATQGIASPTLRQQVQKTLVDQFGGASAQEVMNALGPTFGEFLTNVTPFIGTISSGTQALVKWSQAAYGLYNRSQMEDAHNSFAPGDPAAAFEAILKIQTRAINSDIAVAGIRTTAAGAKAAFTAADFGAISGPALGAAESLALLMQKIHLFARDWNEMKSANRMLESGELDFRLFKAHPLLGCYLIGNSDTSAIINIAVGDYGKPGWKLEVEQMVKKAGPVFEKSREVIRAARFEIKGLQGQKGTVVDRKATTIGLPTGKLDGAIEDVSNGVKKGLASIKQGASELAHLTAQRVGL